MNCAIIGAGQLGSRHLQGLLTVQKYKLTIYVVDLSIDSLEFARERANEISHFHNLIFINSIEELAKELNFVVIATNSNVRFNVLKILLEACKVAFLILEKVLFPKIQEFDDAVALIRKSGTQCWVNHPRRLNNDYKELKQYFDKDKIFSFQLVGSSWGLACNALHYIDLFEYLTDSSLKSISCANLNPQPLESKRNGFIEFDGNIIGTLTNNHIFSISSLSNTQIIPPTISIMTDHLKIYIQEGGKSKIYLFHQENNFKPLTIDLTLSFQSQLTGSLFEQLIQNNSCDLPSILHATQTHKIFIQSLLNHWNKSTGKQNILLPIT